MSTVAVRRLVELLKRCTAVVTVGYDPVGTAFFIDDRHLLTSAHVVDGVQGGAKLEVRPYGSATLLPARIDGEVHPEEDLALLSVATSGARPCPLLDRMLDEGGYHVVGYPGSELYAAGLEVVEFTGTARRDPETTEPMALVLHAGKQLTLGHSGSPVLSATTGAVVGVVRYSLDTQGALGGGAVPIDTAARLFDKVAQVVDQPPTGVREWRDIMGRANWGELRKPWDLLAQADLLVTGDMSGWQISLGRSGEPCDLTTVRDLGPEVADAIFRWAQRQRIRGRDEVELLGRLLAGALFPPGVQQRFQALGASDDILVRVHVQECAQRHKDLASIPWELAAVPGGRSSFLAVDNHFRFARVVDGHAPAVKQPVDDRPAQLLAIVAQPPDLEFPVIYGQGDRTSPWPDLDHTCKDLEKRIGGTSFRLDLAENPEPSSVRDMLEAKQYDMVHYIGIGRMYPPDEPQLALVDDAGWEVWENLGDFLGWASASGVKVVVLEFTLPPVTREYVPITPGAVARALKGTEIGAVVLTRLPVHPRQFDPFNHGFYDVLKAGGSIEEAVQAGRRPLERNRPLNDAACFGWFVLITGEQSEIRLVLPPDHSLRQGGFKQQGAA